MPIRLTVTLAVSLLVLGASYAFADGILNDGPTTRARGGVGNYMFWSMRDSRMTEENNELVNSEEDAFETEPTYFGGDELSIRQSSAVAPLRTVAFPRSSAKVRPSETEELDEIASALKADPALKAQVTGFTDSEGPSSKNDALASARAKAVISGLKSRGISGDQLSWSAKGERDPLSGNDTAEGRAQNRRVEVHFE